MDTARARVADRVRAVMEAKGENPNSLATKSHIPRVTLIRKLAGGGAFDVEELYAIAGVLQVRMSELVPEADAA